MGVRVIPSLLSKGGSLVIDNKVDRERGTFKSNVNVEGVDWQEFKRVYNSIVKINV